MALGICYQKTAYNYHFDKLKAEIIVFISVYWE